ncbi:MAG: class I SAM-dependent methyltransferase [Anaerolineae bacterium]|nr:class I SAM-dependent methyltransferase [Anaerolineae bacterium]
MLALNRSLYLDLLKRTLINTIYDTAPTFRREDGSAASTVEAQMEGDRGWSSPAHTMIGMKRLNNVQFCVEAALANNIPGDMIETGVWRGGACIFMRGVLKAYGVTDRVVWVADSFEGLPPPNLKKYPEDVGLNLHLFPQLAVSLEQVQANFQRYDLLDDQVRFLKGWFRDTLPSAPIEQLAVLRLDGDLYESTMDALVNLYPKVAPGGYVIIDDYGVVEACRKAVHDYHHVHNLRVKLHPIDGAGVYWQKPAA